MTNSTDTTADGPDQSGSAFTRLGIGRPDTEALSATESGLLRVPAITAVFWLIKALSTALGESSSDYLVHRFDPPLAVVLGFVLFVAALAVQFSMRRYWAPTYWFAVVAVGVFGTMAADVMHVGLGVPYFVSVILCSAAMVGVFVLWQRSEGTLSIHSIDTTRREVFYWATVVATFALGTAAGDLVAVTFKLGYFPAAVLFAAVLAVPAVGFWKFGWNPIFSFWFAYIATRPVGASLADWMGKSHADGGLGWGAGPVSVALGALIVVAVGLVTFTRSDVQVQES